MSWIYTMKVFVIFLCMVIGYAGSDLQRIEIGKDDLKAKENAMEAASLGPKERNIQDKYIRSKYVHASVHSVATSSNETETFEQLPSVVTSMTEEKKMGQKVYFGTRVMHNHLSLLKHLNRKTSKKVQKSYPETSAVIRRTDAYFATKLRKLFRAKRSPERDQIRSNFAPFQITRDIMTIRSNLPIGMMKTVYATNEAEGRLLDSLAEFDSASADMLNQYKAAKNLERQTLKNTVAANRNNAKAIIDSYKALIRDGAYDDYLYDHFKLREKHAEFFDKPSAALTEYNNLKRQEFDSLDSFMTGSNKALYKPEASGILNGKVKDKPRTRYSRSHSFHSQGQMLVIFLCMVVGYAARDLQRVELGEDDLKANENAKEAVSLDAKERNIQDQYIRSKDVHASVHSVASSSNESETY